jgi:pimeloyl-ACP methyl ester carboxylesterase
MGISPSVAGRRYDMDTLIDLVNEVVDSLYATTGPLILVGHSFGATLVAAVAGRRNHKVRGVVFVSPVVIPASKRRQPTERLSWLAIRYTASLLSRLPLGFAQRMIRLQAADILATATLARRGRSGFRRIREASRPERSLVPDPSAVADQMLAAARYGCLESATKVDTPSWIIAGTADAMSTVEDLHRLQGALNARLELIPGGGHLAHHEDADEVREALERAVAALA